MKLIIISNNLPKIKTHFSQLSNQLGQKFHKQDGHHYKNATLSIVQLSQLIQLNNQLLVQMHKLKKLTLLSIMDNHHVIFLDKNKTVN